MTGAALNHSIGWVQLPLPLVFHNTAEGKNKTFRGSYKERTPVAKIICQKHTDKQATQGGIYEVARQGVNREMVSLWN